MNDTGKVRAFSGAEGSSSVGSASVSGGVSLPRDRITEISSLKSTGSSICYRMAVIALRSWFFRSAPSSPPDSGQLCTTMFVLQFSFDVLVAQSSVSSRINSLFPSSHLFLCFCDLLSPSASFSFTSVVAISDCNLQDWTHSCRESQVALQ